MPNKQLNQLPLAATIYTDSFIATESPSTPLANQTQKASTSQLIDQTSITNPAGVFKVNQPGLTGLTGSLNSTANNLTVSINGGTASATANLVNSNSITYNGDTLNVSINGVADSKTVNGTIINVSNPTTESISTLNTSLSDIFAAIGGGGGLSPFFFTSPTLSITTQQLIFYTGTTDTVITLPASAGIDYPIRIFGASATEPHPKVTVQRQGSDLINDSVTSVFTTKSFQLMEFFSTTVGWAKPDSARGFQTVSAGSALQFFTEQLDGGAASYTLLNGGRYIATVMDNILTASFKLQVDITGTPTSALYTNIIFRELLANYSFSSISQGVGFSKEFSTTQDFYYWFAPTSGGNNIIAQTAIPPSPGSYTVSVFIQATLF